MSQTIKISDSDANILRAVAPIASRSIAGQAEHWMRIGRVIESSPSFSYSRITDALAGLVDPDSLNTEEQVIFFDKFSDAMGETTEKQELFFAERRKKGLGVGLDENEQDQIISFIFREQRRRAQMIK